MKTICRLITLALIAVFFTACEKDEGRMLWKVVSNSDPEAIQVVIESDEVEPNASGWIQNVWVKAMYREGDLVLMCTNHDIQFDMVFGEEGYTNNEMGFTLSKVDSRTLKIHFDLNASGRPETTDQIAIPSKEKAHTVYNTALWITRSFGELEQ